MQFIDYNDAKVYILGAIVIEILLIKASTKDNKITSIIMILVILFFTNLLLCSCFDWIFSLGILNNLPIELIIHVISSLIIFLLCITKIRIVIQNILKWTSKFIKLLMMISLIICSVLSVLIINKTVFMQYPKLYTVTSNLFLLLMAIILLVFPILIIYSLSNKQMKKTSENYMTQIAAQSRFYSQLSKSNFELRRFKHNYKNTNIALTKLLSEGKSDEALKLIEAQNQELNSTSVQFDTGNGIVDALFTDKQNQADKINTTIKFEGAVPGNAIDAVDLCIIFGNPLDNAIEACSEIDTDTPKEIHIRCVCNSGFAFIEMTNPVQKKVEIRGNLPETTKPDKEMHGFGLYSLEKVIKKYDGKVTCECDETAFKLSMEFSIPVRDS